MREFWILRYKLNDIADLHVSRVKPLQVDPSWEVIHVVETDDKVLQSLYDARELVKQEGQF